MTKFKLSATKTKFYSSLAPEQFNHYSDEIWGKISKCKTKEAKVRLEQEYTALLDLYAEINQFKIGSLVEIILEGWKDWSEDETEFYVVEKFMYESFNDISNQPVLSLITSEAEDPNHITNYKVVTPEKFQWMVNHYPEKMIMVYNDPKLKLKTNPLYNNIVWPADLKDEKELVDLLTDIGL